MILIVILPVVIYSLLNYQWELGSKMRKQPQNHSLDEGLMLETSSLDTHHGGQSTLLTYICCTPR